MDKRFKLPLLIMVWTIVIVTVVFGLLFIYGSYLAIADPTSQLIN